MLERRVGQAEAERETDLLIGPVVRAVADEEALAVADDPETTREVEVRRVVLQPQRHRLGQLPRRVDGTGDQIGRGTTGGLTAQPALQDRRGVLLPGRHPHYRAVGQHHDQPVVHGGQGLDQRHLVGRQIHMRPVEALRLGAGRQAQEDQHVIGVPGGGHGLLGQLVIPLGASDAEAGAEADGDALAEGGPELVESNVDPGRVHLGTARALIARRPGELPDHRHRAARRRTERQDVAVVLQQHRRLRGRPPRQGVMGVEVHGGRIRQGGPSLLDQPEHPPYGLVQHRFVQFAGAHRRDHRLIADPEIRRHLQVQPGGHGRDPIMHRTPVRHHDPVETPLVPEHLGQQPVVFGRVRSVDLVVRAHHRPRLRLLDHRLEGRQVDLPQGPLVHLGADPEPVVFLVVGGVVLHRRADALALDALDHGGRQGPGQVGVFRHVLEVAPAQG